MRKPFVAGNWKMNTDSHSCVELAKAVAGGALDAAGHSVDVAVCPPFVYLQAVAVLLAQQVLRSALRMFIVNRREHLPAR